MTKEFKLILATSNKDKVREIGEILKDTPFVAVSMRDEGFDPDIVEDGKTFEENALIKARAVHALAFVSTLWTALRAFIPQDSAARIPHIPRSLRRYSRCLRTCLKMSVPQSSYAASRS